MKVLSLLAIFLLGCTTTVVVDSFSWFAVDGVAHSSEGAPVENAEVFFVDTGLDEWTRGRPIHVGFTDADGRLATTLSYTWGYSKREKSRKVRRDIPRTFELLFKTHSGPSAKVLYRLDELPRARNSYIVTFDVTLEQ